MATDVLTVPAAQVSRNFGRYQDEALRRPVEVTSNGRSKVVIISSDEYARLKSLDVETFQTRDLGAEFLALLMNTEPPEEAEQFNHEHQRSKAAQAG
jgi:prevent-host-death family protein